MENHLKNNTYKILILDFGSQVTQLIAKRIRKLQVYCEIHPGDLSSDEILKFAPRGIILSGGPNSAYTYNTLQASDIIYKLNIPILGICYGMQMMAMQLGGKVAKSDSPEFGNAHIYNTKSVLLDGIYDDIDNNTMQVWMSHSDEVTAAPMGFEIIASSNSCKIAAMADESKHLYAVQFHPEVSHTNQGIEIFKRFLFNVCKCYPNWTMPEYMTNMQEQIKLQVQDDHVILALSGGVDSTVAAKLIHNAIGNQLTCIFVDTGLMRHNEATNVMNAYREMGLDVILIDAKDRFYSELKDVNEPEEKRKICGRLFVEIFTEQANKIKNAKYLAQGTIYPDVIESAVDSKHAHTIKSHHNVGGLPDNLSLLLLEPLRTLFKDEVRSLGITLGIPSSILNRHPFPGPGLAIRVVGEITPEKVTILQQADAIFIEELIKNNYYDKTSQAFAVFLPVKSVGVMGDYRTYEYVIALRAVVTDDFMTAKVAELPFEFITHVANRIVNEVSEVNRVVYDITSKPPSTIEWE